MSQVGEITAWGDDSAGQLTVPTGNDFAMIAPGGSTQSLAMHMNGRLTLWGAGGASLKGALASDEFVDAALSLLIVIAVRKDNKEIEVDGDYLEHANVRTRVVLPADMKTRKVSAVAAGGGHCVVIGLTDQLLYQCGPLAQPHPAGKFTHIRAKHGYTIGLAENGDLYGWGTSLFPLPAPNRTPPVPGATSVVKRSGIAKPGISNLESWESNPRYNPNEIPQSRAAYIHQWRGDADGHWFVPGPFIDLAAGAREGGTASFPHILALRPDGTVAGWGANAYKQLQAPDGVRFRAIAAGKGFSIGIDDSGKPYHWGDPGPETHPAVTPAFPSHTYALQDIPDGPFSSISAALRHVAAVGGIPLRRGLVKKGVLDALREGG